MDHKPLAVGSRQGTRAGPDQALPAPLRRMNHLVGAGFRLYDTLSPCIKAHALQWMVSPEPRNEAPAPCAWPGHSTGHRDTATSDTWVGSHGGEKGRACVFAQA